MKISLLTPTRCRPVSVERMVSSAYQMADDKENLEMIFYVDYDDPAARKKLNGLSNMYPVSWTTGSRVVLSEMWNTCYEHSSKEIVMHCGDDIVFKTKGWDTLVRKAFEEQPDKILLVHGNDLIHGGTLATHSFLHRNWVEAVGYFLPPYFISDYNDTWLTDVAHRIGRIKYIPELITEHMHFSVGKAEKDQNTIDRLERAAKDDPGKIYQHKELERIQNAWKLQDFIRNYK